MAATRCSTHRSAIAGWSCPLCHTELCGACAALTAHQVVVCATCGTLAARHLAPRAEVTQWPSSWRRALSELWSPKGGFQILLFAVAVNTLVTYGARLWPVGWLLAAAWVLNLARRTALGLDAFALPLWEDLRLVAVGALPRFLVVGAPLGAGAMRWTDFGLVARPLTAPWPWLLAAAAVAWVPAAAVLSSIEGAGAGIPRPWRRFAPGDLAPLRGAVAIAAAAELLASTIAPVNRALEDTRMLEHLAVAFLPRLVTFGALAALGVLAGALVFHRAGELGHRRPEDDLVPRIAEAPTGRWAPPVPDPVQVAAEQARRFAPIALDEAPVQTAIDRGAKDEAITAYRLGEVRADALDPARAVALAQWLAGDGDFAAAARLLEVATARPDDGPALAKAMVVLARLCAERLGDAARSRRLYAEVVRRFPGSPAAKFAAEQLAGEG